MAETTPKQSKRLEGRVAQVLNERELVITLGSEHGVTRGMKFAILSEKPLEIVDPTTNVTLDTIDREKVRVEANDVRGKITICRTYRMIGAVEPAMRLSAAAYSLQGLFGSAGRPETLNVRDSSLPPPLPPEQSYVKTNDRAIQVPE